MLKWCFRPGESRWLWSFKIREGWFPALACSVHDDDDDDDDNHDRDVFSKDCRLPVQLQRAMAAEAEAAREARAKVRTQLHI